MAYRSWATGSITFVGDETKIAALDVETFEYDITPLDSEIVLSKGENKDELKVRVEAHQVTTQELVEDLLKIFTKIAIRIVAFEARGMVRRYGDDQLDIEIYRVKSLGPVEIESAEVSQVTFSDGTTLTADEL